MIYIHKRNRCNGDISNKQVTRSLVKILQLIGLFIVSTYLFSCASTAPVSKPSVTQKTEVAPTAAAKPVTTEVSKLTAQYKATNDLNTLLDQLIKLADNYQSQSDCLSTNIVLKHSISILDQVSVASTIPAEDVSNVFIKANILRAECAILPPRIAQNIADEQTIQKADTLPSLDSNISLTQVLSWINSAVIANETANTAQAGARLDAQWSSRLKALRAYKLGLEEQYENALVTLLAIETDSSPLQILDDQLIFYWLAQLTANERMDAITRFPELFKYQRLLNVVEDRNINDAQRQLQLNSLVSDTTANNQFAELPEQISRYLSLEVQQEQTIAVLLPLSGRLSSQGEAIKQGVIAAYYEQVNAISSATTLSFIDTGSNNDLLDSVNAESLSGFSVIVGPLLKSHIDAVQSIAPKQSLKLFLNQLDDNSLSANTLEVNEETAAINYSAHFFALSPEQEAQQLAKKMLEQNIAHPVLIYDSSNITGRMTDAFLDEWARAQDSDDVLLPSKVKYADNKSMRVGITSALDVLQSQQRINQLSNLVNEKVYSVTRNRRDVDAFVVFARPNEVELINPIIESSMSLFTGQQLPVFATSYSYNHKQNKNTLRDLRNLVFMDMPFVLPQGRNSKLATDVNILFNEPSSTYLRLFAFGYDALASTQHILKLSVFEQLSMQGLSGELSVGPHNTMTRELSVLNISADN
jgi:outer membrane PBP1 activator LpoA protein